MVENRPLQNVMTHGILILGIVVIIFPIYIAFVASIHRIEDALSTVRGWFGNELAEAARVDGAGPVRFFLDELLPLSCTNIAALFVILFIYGWNQYLWPIIITADTDMTIIVMATNQMLTVMDGIPDWSNVMATAMLALLPLVAVAAVMQRLFVKGLIETEK